MAYEDEDTDKTVGNGFYRIKLHCPCMDLDGGGKVLERTWDRREMILVDDPKELIASHKCP